MTTTSRAMHPDERASLQATVKSAIKQPLKWRRHGIGLLQAYLHEAGSIGEPEVRVHIWHPSARRPGIIDHGDIHNHRFDFDSAVLVGSIDHQVYTMRPVVGDWGAYEVVHARMDIGARYQLEPSIPKFALAGSGMYRFSEGQRYGFSRGSFHRSYTDDLCVTLITKRNQCTDKALVLARLDSPPVHAFEADDNFDMQPIIDMAINALSHALCR